VYRGALSRPPYRAPTFWFVMLLAPIPALMLFASRWPRRAPRAISPERALSMQTRKAPGDVRAVRRAFLSAIAARIRVPATQLAEPRALERAARRAGTSPETAAGAAALLDEMNAAAFSAQPTPVRDVSRRAQALYRRVDNEARTFSARVAPTVVIFLLATLLTVRASAFAPDMDGAQFARGVQAYDQGRFGVAEGEFLALARRVPRAADAWANLGTAAYAAADTAHAVIGWQRALRLEPLATDARDRLEYIGAAPGSGIAAIPAIPVVPLALLAAALWLGGWLLLAWCIARRRTRGRLALITCALGAAIALAGAAAVLDARLAARDLGVLARETPLRLLPSLGAQSRATMHSGDMARITNRSGVWVHVEADGGKAGWMEAAALISIARD
jgi:tetratricopeptide (TPR) repeat protein